MIRKILILFTLLLTSAYLIAALSVLNRKPQGAVCQWVECIIKDSIQSAFISSHEVENILKNKKLYPKGKKMDSIVCRTIETYLKKDSRIENVECYKSPMNCICIEIVQRLPILRIISSSGESYFVDSKGKIMPQVQSAAYLAVATGNIDKAMACKELYELGMFLQKDKFWNAQIQQINVTPEKELELVPRVGDHIVFLGKPDQFEKKLSRLKAFYEKALNKVGWNKYSRISLEFNNQVICTKKEK